MGTKRKKTAAKKRPATKKQRAKTPLRTWVKRFLILIFAGVVAAFVGIALIFWFYGRDLPDIDNIEDYRPAQVSRVYAADGNVIASYTDQHRIFRTVVSSDEISQVMRDAMVAAEDSGFYRHQGLDYPGLLRAVYTNVRRGEMTQGASTITQQVVKNLVLSPERTIRRKVQEALLAFRLERSLSKDEILTIYLNEIFFGVHFYGVEEAARYYFGHSAAELELHEAALLAGIVQSPNRYNPYRHAEAARARRSYVLRQMQDKGYIEEGARRAADALPLGLVEDAERRPLEGAFPWYADAVRRRVIEIAGEDALRTGGLRIETAMVPSHQRHAQNALQAGLRAFDARHGFHTPFATVDSEAAAEEWRRTHSENAESAGLDPEVSYRAVILRSDDEATVVGIGPFVATLEREPVSRTRIDGRPWGELFPVHSVFTVHPVRRYTPDELSRTDAAATVVHLMPSAQGAIVVINPRTRHVEALVGGYDFARSPFNRAVQARRQVGSAFKPFVYAAALHAEVATPATIFLDQPVTFPMPGGQSWRPENYDHRYLGEMSLRTALARSRNVIAVRALDLVGLGRVQAMARAAGIESTLTDNYTLALGSAELTPLEMTNAVATFAAGGAAADPILVTLVQGPDGEILYRSEYAPRQGVTPEVAWLTTSLMRSVVERGTARRARDLPHEVVGKTGTTNGARDAWFVGYSPHLVAGVWIGRDDNQPLGRGEAGGATALPVWIDFMRDSHTSLPVVPLPGPPAGIVTARIDQATGLLAPEGSQSGYVEYFIRGTAPREYAPTTEERTVHDTLLNAGSSDDGGGLPGPDEGGF